MGKAPPILAELRAIGYMMLMIVSGVAVSVADVLSYPIVKFVDPVLGTYHKWTMFAARLSMWPFGITVTVKGRENLPKTGPGILVVNHQSQLDVNICSVGLHDVNFKCTYKRELLFYPGIGSALWMAGHVSVKRGDKNSGKAMMEKCADYIKRGVYILFFAEGTRKIDVDATGPVGEFKPGAFKLALETGAPLIPVSISGARDLMPPHGFPKLGYGQPILTVHKPIYPQGRDIASLMNECRDLIIGDMRPCDAVAQRKPKAGAPSSSPAAPEISSTIAAAEKAGLISADPVATDAGIASPAAVAAAKPVASKKER